MHSPPFPNLTYSSLLLVETPDFFPQEAKPTVQASTDQNLQSCSLGLYVTRIRPLFAGDDPPQGSQHPAIIRHLYEAPPGQTRVGAYSHGLRDSAQGTPPGDRTPPEKPSPPETSQRVVKIRGEECAFSGLASDRTTCAGTRRRLPSRAGKRS